jgi:uncharacterized protein (TIGR02996 family)
MTTEEDFQRVLDRNPEDWQTRLVFADWLQEQDDARAEGYRALAVLRRIACERVFAEGPVWAYWTVSGFNPEAVLPSDWWGKGRDEVALRAGGGSTPPPVPFCRPSRREAEDCAAIAFTRLPARRRAELLAPKEAEDEAPDRKRTKPRKRAAKKPRTRKRKK